MSISVFAKNGEPSTRRSKMDANGHSGEVPGYLMFAVVRPESDDVVVILTNTSAFPPLSLLPAVFAAW